MSEAGNFDDFIKRKFNKYSPEVPSHVWEKIVAERKRRKPKGFWLNFLNSRNILLLTGLLLAGSSGALLLSTYQTSPSKNIITIATNDGQTNVPINQPKNNSIGKTDQLAEADSKNPIKNTNPGSNIGDLFVKTAETKDRAASGKTSNNFPNTKRSGENKNNAGLVNPGNDGSGFIQDDINVANNINIINKEISSQVTLMNRLLSGALVMSEHPQVISELKTNTFPNVALPECPTFEKDAAGNKKYFEFYAGPDYAIRSFSDTPNSAYLKKRKESTSFTSAFSAGARYTRVFKNCMSVRVGLNYSQINEKFSFVQGNVIQVTYIIDPSTGDTTAAYTVRGSQHKTTYNHYKSFDVPLALGYEFGYGRLHANINAGAIINIYSWQKGEVLDVNNRPVSITTGKGSPDYEYKNNLGLSLSGGMAVYYKLNDALHLLAEPYIRYNLSSMSKEDDYTTLRQKFTIIGCRLGVRLDIK